MSGEAYAHVARAIAREDGRRSPATRRTREPFLGVMRKHRKAAYQIDRARA